MDNIRKNYSLNGKEVPILKGINLFVGQGEFVSIMGPSGSGKSTLSAILGCLSTPSAGTYKINGQDITALKSNEVATLRSRSIGFIFQDFNLLSGLSAAENVALPLVYAGIPAKERRARAMECLRAVGLGEKSFNRPNQLSGGQKQRVAIARALVNEPKFLFADEPTGALDKKTGHEILGIIQKLNLQGQTVIQVTHSALDATYSKRILHLVDGNIIRDETVEKPTIAVLSASEHAELDDLVTKVWRVAQFSPTNNPADISAIKHLMQTSTSRNSWIAAARAIVRWKDAEANKILDQLFTSEDWVIRAEVLKYASLRGQKEAILYYIRGLADTNAWVRHTAMVELKEYEQGDLSPEEQLTVLEHLNDPDERVRATLIYIIGKWNIPNAQSILSISLRDSDSRVRANALESIRAHHLEKSLFLEIQPLLQDKNNRVRANAAMLIAQQDPPAAISTVQHMLGSSDPLTRSSGAWLVGAIQPEKGGQILLDGLKNERDDIVINQMVRSLAKLAKVQMPLHQQVQQLFGLGETS